VPSQAVASEIMPETPAELQDALMALSLAWLDEGPRLRSDLARILAVAERTVPGCDAGSITLIVEGQPQTEAMIDRVVVAVDVAQYELGEGPCLTAAEENRPIHVALIPTDERFPRFAERVAHTGVQSSLSLPVVAFGAPVGSLNLYSWTPSSFDASSQDLGAVMATQVGVAVAKSALLTRSRGLAVVAQRRSDENADLAVAHGMLMVLERCSVEQAAALIRNAASSESETLVAAARRVMAEVVARPDGAIAARRPYGSRLAAKSRRIADAASELFGGDAVTRPGTAASRDDLPTPVSAGGVWDVPALSIMSVSPKRTSMRVRSGMGSGPVGRRRLREDGCGRLPAGLCRRPRRR